MTVEKIVALYTSRDRAISESLLRGPPGGARPRQASRSCWPGTRGTWDTLWNRFDIEMDSANEWVETVLHLHIFHLLQTVSPNSTAPGRRRPGPRLARGGLPRPRLLGRDVRLPVPELPAADRWPARCCSTGTRASARPARRPGRRATGGAMFPWQSGSDGREETQRLHLNPQSGPLAARPLAPAAARQHRDRLQRVAALHGHRQHPRSCASPAPRC